MSIEVQQNLMIPGVVFSGALDGHLRGYSTKDGAIVSDTVNGVKARGGVD